MKNLHSIIWIGNENGYLKLIDQTLLPEKLRYINCRSVEDVYHCICDLKIRGAPAIGIASAFGLFLSIRKIQNRDLFFTKLKSSAKYLLNSRPTAINLKWAIDKVLATARKYKNEEVSSLRKIVFETAFEIYNYEIEVSRKIGEYGASLLKDGFTVLTHCNTGFLATSGIGTALSAIYTAHQQGKRIKVFADETRPLLQGARLTTWELLNAGIDVTLICDNMAGYLMKQGKINAVLVGADRIASNGDVANKIGTYSLSVLAKIHKIPFYVVAPTSSFDISIKDGSQIPIEERNPDEVRKVHSRFVSPKNVKVYNPAFDVTPAKNITAIITENGIIKNINEKNIIKIVRNK